MRKVLLLFYLSLMCLGINAQGTQSSTGTLEMSLKAFLAPGGSSDDEGWFTIALKAPNEDKLYTAYQMDIFLPDGIVFDTSEGDACDAYFDICPIYPFTADRRGNKTWHHTFKSILITENHAQVLVADYTNNTPFKSNEGDLFDVYVKATPYAKPGDFQVTIKDIKFVSPDETKYLYEDQTITAGTVSAESSIPVKVTSANKYSTAIFPFSCEMPDGLEAYTAIGLKNYAGADYITLLKSESIAAFTPYILYAENGITETISGTVNAANYPDGGIVSDGYLTGVLKSTEASAGYVMQNKGEGVKFYKIGSTPFVIPAGKCFANPQSADAPALAFMFDDEEATTIKTVSTLPRSGADVIVYDLQGNEVLNPQSGHIYIINGQKVLKK